MLAAGHKIKNPLSTLVQEWQNAASSNEMVKNSTEWVKFIKKPFSQPDSFTLLSQNKK